MTEPLSQVASQGILGALLVVALGAILFLYRELAAERAARALESAARIQDSKDNTALLLKIQQATTDAIGKFYDLVKARRSDERQS